MAEQMTQRLNVGTTLADYADQFLTSMLSGL